MTDKPEMTIGFDVSKSDDVTIVTIRRGATIIGIFSGDVAKAFIELNTEAYARGRRDGLESAAKLIEEWAVYFDKYEAYCGKYAPSTGRETLTPEDCASAIRALTEKEK